MNERVTKSSLYCCLQWIQIHSSFFHLSIVSPTLPSSRVLCHSSPMVKEKFFSSLRLTKEEFVIFHIFLHCSRRFYSNLRLIVISSNFLSTSHNMNLTGLKRNWAFFDLCSLGNQGSRQTRREIVTWKTWIFLFLFVLQWTLQQFLMFKWNWVQFSSWYVLFSSSF